MFLIPLGCAAFFYNLADQRTVANPNAKQAELDRRFQEDQKKGFQNLRPGE